MGDRDNGGGRCRVLYNIKVQVKKKTTFNPLFTDLFFGTSESI